MSISCTALRSAILTSFFFPPGDAVRPIALNFAWTERHCHACKRVAACTRLSTTVSQLFELRLQKIAIFTYSGFHFLFALGTPLWQSLKTLHELKDNSVLAKYSQQVAKYLSIFNSFPVIRTTCAKNRRFHVPQPTFLFSLETPLRLSRNMLHGWKDNSMLAKPLATCIYISSIVSELYDA